jgi:hypothetical protein
MNTLDDREVRANICDEREKRIAKAFARFFEDDICANCFGEGFFWVVKESPTFDLPGVKKQRSIEVCKECLGKGKAN